jgi:hypothetical protein
MASAVQLDSTVAATSQRPVSKAFTSWRVGTFKGVSGD